MNQVTVALLERSVQQLLEDMDDIDDALGAHLIETFGTSTHVPVREGRAAILKWCASPAARATHYCEALAAAAHAMEVIEDELLRSLLRNLVERASRNTRSAA